MLHPVASLGRLSLTNIDDRIPRTVAEIRVHRADCPCDSVHRASWNIKMIPPDETQPAAPPKRKILHLCKREVVRPLRDQILRLSGYTVRSACDVAECVHMFHADSFDLVLIDVEDAGQIHEAEQLCAEVKTFHHGQVVAFVCNWRVAALTSCPDEILRTEFDPAAFVAGVHKTLENR